MSELRQLRYFVAVARALHFGRAAEQLHVTQPPLSRQVAALEKSLGVTLLERNSRNVRLTAAGQRLLEDATGVIAAYDQARRNARAADAGEIGHLTVGFMMHAAYSSVPPIVRRFDTAFPGVELRLREMMSGEIVAAVQDGSIDAGVTFMPDAMRGLSALAIHQEPLCLAAPSGHVLAASESIAPADLAGETIIATLTETAPRLRQAADDWFASLPQPPAVRMEVRLQQTIVNLVAEGLGLALVPQSLRRIGPEGVRFVALENPPSVEHVLLWRPANSNPALAPFLATATPQA